MRTLLYRRAFMAFLGCGLVILALSASAACASRSESAAVSAAPAPASAAASGAGQAQTAPPLTPADLENRMQRINVANQAMRMKLMAGRTMDAVTDAEQIAMWFGDVERFWAEHRKTDAVTWAQDARKYATETAGAATAGDTMKATQAANNMLGACKQCHGTYREMDPNGGFRIKPGALQ